MYCNYFEGNGKGSSIIVLDNPDQKDEYIQYFVEEKSTIPFSFSVLSQGCEVHVLGYENDSLLVHIGYYHKGFSKVLRPYNEFWIWNEFLNETKSDFDKQKNIGQ